MSIEMRDIERENDKEINSDVLIKRENLRSFAYP